MSVTSGTTNAPADVAPPEPPPTNRDLTSMGSVWMFVRSGIRPPNALMSEV